MSKYPRTPHLSFSPGKGADDKVLTSDNNFIGKSIIVTEKIDGSNVCMTNVACFARSHANPPSHPSFNAFKAYHGSVKRSITPNLEVFGEWCFAKHSIRYTKLPSYFLLFGIRDQVDNRWYSWSELEDWAKPLNINTVPVVYRDKVFKNQSDLVKTLTSDLSKPSFFGDTREGFVLRNPESFLEEDFANNIAKIVRKDHVQTEEHWKNMAIVKNLLEQNK